MFLKRWFKYKVNYPKNANNKLILHTKSGTKVNPWFCPKLKIHFKGKNSVVEIFSPELLQGSEFFVYDEDCFVIKNAIGNIFVVGGCKSNLYIDEGSILQNTKFLLNDEIGASIHIGKDCMFAIDTTVWASDTHKICDLESGKILNKARKGIDIGNHVWVGTRCIILKETSIQDGSVVGAGSLVCNQFNSPNIVIAGNPAKQIKTSIQWKREGFIEKQEHEI